MVLNLVVVVALLLLLWLVVLLAPLLLFPLLIVSTGRCHRQSTGCATTVNDCQDPYRTGSNSNAAKDAHTEDVVVPMRSRVCRRHCIVRLDECVWMARLLLTGRQTNEADERPKSVDLAHPEP